MTKRSNASPCRRSHDLAKNIPNMVALFKSRGMDLKDMARKQPDLLLQAPGTLRTKLDAIPGALCSGCLFLHAFVQCSESEPLRMSWLGAISL